MKKYLIALLVASIAWFAPMAPASERAAVVPAVYHPDSRDTQFELVGKRHKKHYKRKHHRHRHHSRSYHRHRSHRHHHYRHYDRCYPQRHYRDYYISVPGFGSFYYRS